MAGNAVCCPLMENVRLREVSVRGSLSAAVTVYGNTNSF